MGSLPWRAGPSSPHPWPLPPAEGDGLPGELFRGPVSRVARRLLGVRLVSTVGGARCVGVIVETEAYGGADDPASHAAVRGGRTRRNASMFLPAGHAYVYRSHGVHWCLNVVTGPPNDPQAVLVRGVETLEGHETMVRRRRGRHPVAAGPGRLCQALGIDGSLDGHHLGSEPLLLASGWPVPDCLVGVSGRIGVRAGAELPLRFYLSGSPGVTPRSVPAPTHPKENG